MQSLFFILPLFAIILAQNAAPSGSGYKLSGESLTPYVYKHGSRLNHRSIRECHKNEYGSSPHELYPAHKSFDISTPFVKVKRFIKDIGTPYMPRPVRGHYVIITDPLKTLSVLEPDQPGGCSLNIRQTVYETSKKQNCMVSVNAGYFDTKQGTCLGNVISDGRIAHDSKGIQNTHFGLTKDGQIFVGYLSHEAVVSGDMTQLVGGVVWILRNGTGFVNASKGLECEDTEETGPMDHFINILSARSAVGHDKEGNVVLVQVDGKSGVDGINLHEMETLLKTFGLVNAVNLDGGGSSTLVVNGTTANYPYDFCEDPEFACDRKVSTILCVHSPYCEPIDCNSHGTCSTGRCICDENWLPPMCDQLFCGQNNCSNNGVCSSGGCICNPGYFGYECNKTCHEGWYGSLCAKQCDCFNSDGCDSITGVCKCKSGFTGEKCEHSCATGFFGKNCEFSCQCGNSCYCDSVTGACEVYNNTILYKAAKCLAKNIIQDQNLSKDHADEQRKWYFTMIVLGVITSLCLASFLLVLCCSCSCRCYNEQVLCFKKNRKRQPKSYRLQVPSGYLSDTMSDSEIDVMQSLQKK